MAHHQPGGFLHNLTRIRLARSGRASSWDQSGRNQDYWLIPLQESIVLPSAAGGTLPQPRPQATGGLTEEMRESIARMEERYAGRREQQARELQQEAERTRRASQGNVEQARKIRASFE